MLVQKDISLVFIAHLKPDLLCFGSFRLDLYADLCIFKMMDVDGGHLELRGQDDHKTLK